jgi:steroid delta-isomerase-like uncharacterized protein
MDREFANVVATRRAEAWRMKDAAMAGSDYADDAVVESPAAGTVSGRQGIEDTYRMWFTAFPDGQWLSDEVLIDGERIVMTYSVKGTQMGEFLGMPPSGKHIEFRGVALMKVKGDKIVHEHRVYDFTGFLVRLGVLKAKPA